MYEVRVKGRNLVELTKAVGDIYNELSNGKFSGTVVKNMTEEVVNELPTSAVVVEEVKVDVAPFTEEVKVDAAGVEWDARIHSSSKSITTKGLWKMRKGVEKTVVDQVVASQLNSTPTFTVPVITTPAPATLAPTLSVTPVEVVAPTPVEVVAPAPVMPSMNTNGHTLETFTKNFAMIMGSLITAGKVSQEYINTLISYFKVSQIWLITDEQKAEVFNGFVNAGIIQKVG